MKTEISKSKFKAHALEIFRELEASDGEVVITDHGQPTLVVRKYREPVSQSPLERLKGSVLRYEEPFESVGADDWEALS